MWRKICCNKFPSKAGIFLLRHTIRSVNQVSRGSELQISSFMVVKSLHFLYHSVDTEVTQVDSSSSNINCPIKMPQGKFGPPEPSLWHNLTLMVNLSLWYSLTKNTLNILGYNIYYSYVAVSMSLAFSKHCSGGEVFQWISSREVWRNIHRVVSHIEWRHCTDSIGQSSSFTYLTLISF